MLQPKTYTLTIPRPLPNLVSGPFGYNEEVEVRVDFSLPVTVLDAETTDDLPALSVVVGSTSTARTLTYLTAAAVYTTEGLSGMNDSSLYGNGSYYNDSSAFFKYLVAADDESVDLRQAGIKPQPRGTGATQRFIGGTGLQLLVLWVVHV